MNLSELRRGERARIIAIEALDKVHRHHLSVMGIKQRRVVTLMHVAPLGCPICVEVDGSVIVLRKAECKGIIVERV